MVVLAAHVVPRTLPTTLVQCREVRSEEKSQNGGRVDPAEESSSVYVLSDCKGSHRLFAGVLA